MTATLGSEIGAGAHAARPASVLPFWTYVAERGEWQRRRRQSVVRVLDHRDTTPVWEPEEDPETWCHSCETGDPHSEAYHRAQAARP